MIAAINGRVYIIEKFILDWYSTINQQIYVRIFILMSAINQIIANYKNKNIFLIAEAGTTHQGDLDKALEIVEKCAAAGASAVKFQHVIAEEILHPLSGKVKLPGGKINLFDTFKKLERPLSFFDDFQKSFPRVK